MFNWLQHLFTARALESELAGMKAQNAEFKTELAAAKAQIKQLEDELAVAQQALKRKTGSGPPIADGVGKSDFFE